VQKDVPKLIDLYKKGDLKLDELISRTITLDQVNEAFDAMKTGEVARTVIEYGAGSKAGAAGAEKSAST
jgi:S-(hydroxymethyl)glutathione dehydrogenase/alcohol dehydrogenase